MKFEKNKIKNIYKNKKTVILEIKKITG